MVFWLVTGCSGSSSGLAVGARQWACSQTDTCSCQALSEHEDQVSIHPTDQCFAGNCCLLTQSGVADTTATCECLTATSCDAEAKTRKGAQVVSQCPPPGEGPNANKACAPSGENCSRSYLSQKNLTGCCDGTVCKPNADQVQVCQVATAEEQRLAHECAVLAQTNGDEALSVTTPTLHTSVGDIQVPTNVTFSFAKSGKNGCLSALEVHLGDGDCNLDLSVEVKSSKFVVHYFSGELSGCPGFSGDSSQIFSGSLLGTDAPADFAFTGLSCQADFPTLDLACESGTFDFHIDGTVNKIKFKDQHVILEGSVCANLNADCPTQ